MSRVIQGSEYGTELVIVENDQYAVLTSVSEDFRVLSEYVRIIDKKNHGKEHVYWSLHEIGEDIIDSDTDYTTAFNAILSSIELVATKRYPPTNLGVTK